jgi:hypothetical protein
VTAVTDWRARALADLVGHPQRSVSLTQLGAPVGQGGPACFLPWTRLQVSMSGEAAPCNAARSPLVTRYAGERLDALWNAPRMVAFRRAVAAGRPGEACRDTCPYLADGRHRLGSYALHGGSRAFVAHQVRRAEQVLAGDAVLEGGPMALGFSYSAACNYDCVMCTVRHHTVEVPLPPAFFADVEAALPTLRWLEVEGGEPFVAPAFLSLLERFGGDDLAHVRLCVTTNGSRLTPEVLDLVERAPFETLNVSVNAATAATYAHVHRSPGFEALRANLADLSARVRAGRVRGSLWYSFVLLRSNVAEIEAFAALALADGARPRFNVPQFNLGGESVLVDAQALARAVRGLDAVAERLAGTPLAECGQQARAVADILRARLSAGVLEPVPDGIHEPPVVR